MKTSTKRVLFWTPRGLGILYAMLFAALVALDVFGEGYGFWQTIGALLLNLVPTYIVVAVLVIAWRWEWVGAILFIGMAVFYQVLSWVHFGMGAAFVISFPLLLAGVLFSFGWKYRAQLRTR